jgi:hypothetical protein
MSSEAADSAVTPASDPARAVSDRSHFLHQPETNTRMSRSLQNVRFLGIVDAGVIAQEFTPEDAFEHSNHI